MIEYLIVAFICGFGCGLVLLAKNMKDNRKEVERIIKNWRIDLDNKSVYIEKLKEEIKRLSN
jgi:hypothetical protein